MKPLRRLAALGWPDAASSVAHVSSGYARSLRPCLGRSHRTQPGGLLSVRRSKIRAMNRRRLVLLALPAACFLAACGGSLTIGSIEDKLNEQIPEEVAAVGVDVSGVDCPDDASVEVGSTFECDVTAVENDQDVIYTATVTVETDDTVGWELTDVRLADGS